MDKLALAACDSEYAGATTFQKSFQRRWWGNVQHETRYSRRHDPELAEYLEAHTVANGDCWEWQRCVDGFGYGLSKWLGKLHRSHRLAYFAEHGRFTPRGVVIRHKCDNPRCCNPAHLIEGTRADNNRDRDRRGRHVRLRGENHGCAKLTEEQVKEIRAAPKGGIYRLADRFGVSVGCVYAVRSYAWRHVEAAAS